MLELISQCSPSMHPVVAQAIIKTESGFNPYAIGVNRGARLTRQPRSYGEAVATAKDLLARGINIDLGLAQINSANLGWLGLSVEQVLHPCTNLTAMQTVYNTCYAKAGNSGMGTRMQRALSCYNTGTTSKGFANGYVSKAMANLSTYPAQNPNQNIALSARERPIDDDKPFLATQVPKNDFDASTGLYERFSDGVNLATNETADLEDILAQNAPTRAYHSWDIFKDF